MTIFLAFLFSIDNLRHIKNITSILTTADIFFMNENEILVASTGGFYKYHLKNQSFNNYTDRLDFVDIKKIEFSESKYWLLGKESNIQILDNNFNLDNVMIYDSFDEIHKILFYNDYIFAIVSDENGEYLAQLSNAINPYYLTKTNSFDINGSLTSINTLNDIYIKDDVLYLATDIGVLSTSLVNYNSNNLSVLLGWGLSIEYETFKIYEDDENIMLSTWLYEGEYCIVGLDVQNCIQYDSSDFVDSFHYGDDHYLLFEQTLFRFGNNLNEPPYYIFELPDNIFSKFQNITINYSDGMFYFGLENHGVLVFHPTSENWEFILPNTILSNNVNSIDANENNLLVGSVDNGSGGFVIDDVFYDEEIKNFYAESKNYFDLDGDSNFETYKFKYPITNSSNSSAYYGKKLSFISGDKSNDIKLDEFENIYFTNSGIYLNANELHPNAYVPFKDELDYLSGLLYINSNNLEIINGWNDPFAGIMNLFDNDQHNYTTLNQLITDSEDNLYIVNPYSEVNKPIAIKYAANDFNWLEDNSPQLYLLPQEAAVDYNNNLWIGYQKKDDGPTLTPGGIRVVQLKDIALENDDVWHNNPLDIIEDSNCYLKPENPNVNISLEDNQNNPISIWSLDIGSNDYGNTVLWVITDYGVMGYVITDFKYSQGQSYLQDIVMTPINCNFYYPYLYFNENSKVRVDRQNNAWIINDKGIRIIKSNGEVFSDEIIIEKLNKNLLSDKINDIVFDDRGYVYIASDKGISIFESSYSKNIEINSIAVSPNPFIIEGNNGLTISNFPNKSTIHIMNLSGKVVKKFTMDNENVIINWDGRDDNGKFLSTGIYLVAGMDSNNSFGVTKLAIVRK